MSSQRKMRVVTLTEREGWVKYAAFFTGNPQLNDQYWSALRRVLNPHLTRYGSFSRRKLSRTSHWYLVFSHAWPKAFLGERMREAAQAVNAELKLEPSVPIPDDMTVIAYYLEARNR